MGHTTLNLRLPSGASLSYDSNGSLVSAESGGESWSFTYQA